MYKFVGFCLFVFRFIFATSNIWVFWPVSQRYFGSRMMVIHLIVIRGWCLVGTTVNTKWKLTRADVSIGLLTIRAKIGHQTKCCIWCPKVTMAEMIYFCQRIRFLPVTPLSILSPLVCRSATYIMYEGTWWTLWNIHDLRMDCWTSMDRYMIIKR